MILSFLFFASQVAVGLISIKFFDKENRFSLLEKILSTIIIGGVLSGFFILIIALLLKSLLPAILIFISLALAYLITCFFHGKWWTYRPKISLSVKNIFSFKNTWIIFLGIILFLYWILIYSVLFGQPFKAALAGWGDTAVHIDIMQRMATAQPFIVDNPVIGNTHLTYSFLIDFISALFLKSGSSFIFAFRFPLLLYGTCALLLLFSIASRILKSKSFAALALFLILLGSGFGFSVLFKDLQAQYAKDHSLNLVTFILSPPHEYSHLDNSTGGKPENKNTQDNVVWIIPEVSFLSHQRSFSLGLALFSVIFLGIISYGKNPLFWRFGMLAGLLPLAHIHSFLALFLLMATLFIFYVKNWKPWIYFGMVTAIFALPQIIYVKSGGNIAPSPLKPWLGWMNCDHTASWISCNPPTTSANPFFFWANNFGVIFLLWLVVILAAIFLALRHKKLIAHFQFIVASAILFIIPNLFLLQPWSFDNNKILFYWWILAIIFGITPLLMFLWKKNAWGKIGVILLVVFCVLAGSVDFAARLLTPQSSYYGYADSNDNKVKIGQWIKENTLPNSLFLTAPSIDPSPLFLAGRPVYLAYVGWIWSWGLQANPHERAITQILDGNISRACQEKISYILLDNELKDAYPVIQENVLLAKGTVVFTQKTGDSKTYIIKTPCQP